MLVRIWLILFAVSLVSLLLAWSLTRDRKYLAWTVWLLKIGVGAMVLLGLFYVLERLVLR
jgi:hypothetical protein